VGNKEFKSWWDLSAEEKLRFAKQVADSNLAGWDNLKQAAYDFGFEPTEDMPTVLELKTMADN